MAAYSPRVRDHELQNIDAGASTPPNLPSPRKADCIEQRRLESQEHNSYAYIGFKTSGFDRFWNKQLKATNRASGD